MRTNHRLMVDQGIEEAAKATTLKGELQAWDRVVAGHIDVLTDNWRPPSSVLRFLEAAADRRRARRSP